MATVLGAMLVAMAFSTSALGSTQDMQLYRAGRDMSPAAVGFEKALRLAGQLAAC